MSRGIIYVGSSCEDELGVGSLIKWEADEVDINYDFNREKGAWKVTEKGGSKSWFCYDLMRLEAGWSAIEESSLDEYKLAQQVEWIEKSTK